MKARSRGGARDQGGEGSGDGGGELQLLGISMVQISRSEKRAASGCIFAQPFLALQASGLARIRRIASSNASALDRSRVPVLRRDTGRPDRIRPN